MRADAHYVDQLVAPPTRRLPDDDPRPAVIAPPLTSEAPPAVKAPETVPLDATAIAASLSAVLSCTDLLNEGTPRLARAVAVDMIRAETQRAICALRTSDTLRHGVAQERRLVEPRTIISRVVESVAAETRLRGCRVTTAIDVSDFVKVRVDESSVVTALSSVVLMLVAGLHDLQGARLDLEVTGTAADRVTFVISQESVILPDACLKIANTPGERGTSAMAPLVAMRQVAAAHGGSVSAIRLPHGTQVSLELPTSDVM
jgi:hypothetical protein